MISSSGMKGVLEAVFLAQYERLKSISEYKFLYDAINDIIQDVDNVEYDGSRMRVFFPEQYSIKTILLPQNALVVFYRENGENTTKLAQRLVNESPFAVIPGFINHVEGLTAELHFAPTNIIAECAAKTFYYELTGEHYVNIDVDVTLLLNEISLGFGPRSIQLETIPEKESALA